MNDLGVFLLGLMITIVTLVAAPSWSSVPCTVYRAALPRIGP